MATEMEAANISIRKFYLNDCNKLSELIIRTIRQSLSEDYSQNQIDAFVAEFSPEKIREAASTRSIYIAIMDDQAIATASIAKYKHSEGYAILLSVFVDPSSQGLGVGTMIVEYVEMEARNRSFHAMIVPSSITARGFYETLGYKFDELLNESQSVSVWMTKPLLT